MYKLVLAFVSLFFVNGTPAAAAGSPQSNWMVTQLSGDARVVHPGAQPASLKVDSQLAPGDILLTGMTGRATLVRGGDYIVVAPRSELRVPSTPQPAGFTRVIQKLGTLLFKVQHTGIPHFAVDTPMLAAVVKGTTFTVVVDQHRSAVQVIQGVVQVSTLDGAMSRMVEGGRTVFVNHDQPKMLLDADKTTAPVGAASSTSVTVSAAGESPLSAIAALTGGLVRADLSTPQQSVTDAANAAAPPIVQSVVASVSPAPATAPATTTPTVAAPGAGTPTAAPAVSVSTVTVSPVPIASTATVTVPSLSTPIVSVGTATGPSVTTSTISIGSNSGPGSMNSGPGSINSGSGSTSTVTVQPVSTPTVTMPSLTTPAVTVPTVTTPTIETPLLTVPSISTPTVTVPTVTTPTITVPTVTTPTVSVPPVTTIISPITNLLKL